MSIEALAEKAGVSNKTITQIENGRQLPRFRTIRKLSEALGVEASEVTEFVAAVDEMGKAQALNSPGLGPARVPAVG
jgi:transcriptional regulator with XRE-family HTH domain